MASATTLSSGGTLELAGGAITADLAWVGGTVELGAGYALNDQAIASGAAVVVLAGATAEATVIDAGGVLELGVGGALVAPVSFANGGTLQIDGTDLPSTPISGFAAGAGTIDLANIGFDPAGSAVLTAGNVLQITELRQTYSLQLDPAQNFAGDVSGGCPAMATPARTLPSARPSSPSRPKRN